MYGTVRICRPSVRTRSAFIISVLYTAKAVPVFRAVLVIRDILVRIRIRTSD
jgi:hypothetical protein